MNQNENNQDQMWLSIQEWVANGYSIILCRSEDRTNADQVIAKKEEKCTEFLRAKKRRFTR